MKKRGSILIEAVIALPVIITALIFLIDSSRRMALEVALQQVACLRVRAYVLSGQERVHRDTKRFLTKALGDDLGERVLARARYEEKRERGKASSEVFYRYPQFLSFQTRRGRSHHDEILKRCTYPLS